MKENSSEWSKKASSFRENIDLTSIGKGDWSECFLRNNSFVSKKRMDYWDKLDFFSSMGVRCDELSNRIYRKKTKIEGVLLTYNTNYIGVSLNNEALFNIRNTFFDIENGVARFVDNEIMYRDKGEIIINTNKLLSALLEINESQHFSKYLSNIGDNYKQLGWLTKAYLDILIQRYAMCPTERDRDSKTLQKIINGN